MPFVSYPTANDVEALLKSASYWPTDETKQEFARLQADIGARAAADEWERLTGWSPFLIASNAPTPRRFSVFNGRIDFQGSALKIESVTVGDQAVTNYRVLPDNAVATRSGITALKVSQTGGEAIVTATWGRVTYVPGDVWQAVQQKAALIALTQIENLQSVASISEDGFSKAFDIVGIVTQKDLVGIWGKDFEKLATRWARVVS